MIIKWWSLYNLRAFDSKVTLELLQ